MNWKDIKDLIREEVHEASWLYEPINEETNEETTSIDNEFNEQSIPFEEELDIVDFSYESENIDPQNAKPNNKLNPIKDKESIFSRIFRGRTERY